MNDFNTFLLQYLPPLSHTSGAALILLAAFYGTGKLLLRSFPREHLIAFGCGTALFMTFFSLLPGKPFLLWGTALPFALWGIWKAFQDIRKAPFPFLAGSLFFLFTLGSALLLPYAWDEQTYQLAVPLRMLQEKSFAPAADNPYSFYPGLTGWFFANAVTLGGITLPRILVSAITPFLLAGVWRITRQHGKRAAFAAVGALLLSPCALALNRGVYVENFIALFTLTGFLAAWKLRKENFWAVLLAGLLAGCAFAVKPTGILGSWFLFSLFLFKAKEWKKAVLFCGIAFLFSFFWYLRTFLYTGNFFYPYALAPLPGSVEHFHKLLGSARYGLEGSTGALLNWLFAGFDRQLFDGIVTGIQLPVLTVCALTGAFLQQKKHHSFRKFFLILTAGGVFPLLLWSILFPQSRFLLCLLPFAVAGGVITLAQSRWKKQLFCGLFILLLAAGVFQARSFLYHYIASWRLASAVRQTPAKALPFLTRDPGLFKSFEFLASSTAPEAKCLLLMERRGLYCPRRYTIAAPGFEPSLTPVPENAEKLFEKLSPFDYIIVGSTTQDVDLQSISAGMCEQIVQQLNELLARGKLKQLSNAGYPVLKVIKESNK